MDSSPTQRISVQVKIEETVVFAQEGKTAFQVELFGRSLDAAEVALRRALESIDKFRTLL